MTTANKPKLNEDKVVKVHKTRIPLKETMQAVIPNIKQISNGSSCANLSAHQLSG